MLQRLCHMMVKPAACLNAAAAALVCVSYMNIIASPRCVFFQHGAHDTQARHELRDFAKGIH